MVNVLPEPVIPRSVCASSPSLSPSTSSSIAFGWSPDGLYLDTSFFRSEYNLLRESIALSLFR